MNAASVCDFTTADAYLGKKLDRPLCNNTRLIRLNVGEIGVKLYNTYVIVYVADGTYVVNTGGWWTPTTLKRIGRFSPARVSGHAIHHASDPISPPKVWKCRVCHGSGLGSPSVSCGHSADCTDSVMIWGDHLGEHGRLSYWVDGAYTPIPTWTPADHDYLPVRSVSPCYRCGGKGRTDYGSNPIPHPWDGGPLHVDATGKVMDDDVLPKYEPLDLSAYTMPKPYNKTASGWYSEYKPVPTPSIDSQLRAVFPALGAPARCPIGCNTNGGVKLAPDIGALVIHLNDTHKWTREAIADWLESTDIDLTFHGEEVIT